MAVLSSKITPEFWIQQMTNLLKELNSQNCTNFQKNIFQIINILTYKFWQISASTQVWIEGLLMEVKSLCTVATFQVVDVLF